MELKLLSHVYWLRKKQFMLLSDTYPCWTLFAVEAGQFSYNIGEERGSAEFGDLVLCPPHIAFQRQTLEPLTFHFLQFVWLKEPFASDEPPWSGKLSVNDKDRLLSDYQYLRRFTGWDEGSTLHKQHMLNDMLRLVMLEQGEQVTNIGHRDALMDEAKKRLSERAYESFSMQELAEQLDLTPVQLTRRFRKAFGETPSEALNEIRLTRARHLLEGSTLKLDEIAAQCGYENGFYLSRVFTKKTGMAPSIYRSLHRV
ncbi:helix-turn-helix domain-containing protein [Paenibacillus sp. UNC451MF]|uniref:helix-turn-helix domain-containing protein n=1 Tax=Paenibacillus sp. UNC451MF TaxID=1449063 RepID=UPI00056A4BC9|nr:AraC family transcriptional regulator [Paenibacillus sp. UNC451MF]